MARRNHQTEREERSPRAGHDARKRYFLQKGVRTLANLFAVKTLAGISGVVGASALLPSCSEKARDGHITDRLDKEFGISVYKHDLQSLPHGITSASDEESAVTLARLWTILSDFYDPVLIQELHISVLTGKHSVVAGKVHPNLSLRHGKNGYTVFLNVDHDDHNQEQYIHHELFHALTMALPGPAQELYENLTAITHQSGWSYGSHSSFVADNQTVFVRSDAAQNAAEDAAYTSWILFDRPSWIRYMGNYDEMNPTPMQRKIMAVQNFYTENTARYARRMDAAFFEGYRNRN